MNRRIDVFDQVRQMEQGKADLLLSVAQLYQTLSTMDAVNQNDIGTQLAVVIAQTYTLGGKLGWESEALTKKVSQIVRVKHLAERESGR